MRYYRHDQNPKAAIFLLTDDKYQSDIILFTTSLYAFTRNVFI